MMQADCEKELLAAEVVQLLTEATAELRTNLREG